MTTLNLQKVLINALISDLTTCKFDNFNDKLNIITKLQELVQYPEDIEIDFCDTDGHIKNIRYK